MSKKEDIDSKQAMISSIQEEIERARVYKNERKVKEAVLSFGVFENPMIHNFVVSAIALSATNTLLAPLERLKTILQTNSVSRIPLSPNSALNAYVKIWNEQGAITFLRGNMANVYKFTLTAFARTLIYERFKLKVSTKIQ